MGGDSPRTGGKGSAVEGAGDQGQFRITFGLRVKITLMFLLISLAASAILAAGILVLLERSLFREMQSRVGGLARVSAAMVDKAALARLLGRLEPGMPAEEVAEVEASRDFRTVSDALNSVRATEERLVRYIYLFAATPDPAAALFVVDADVLASAQGRAAGGGDGAEDVSHFGSVFDVSGFPVARRALAERVPLVEVAYSWDADYRVNSLTGYAPVFAADGTTFLAAVGIDMVDSDVRAALRSARTVATIVIAAAVVLTVLASVIMGSLFTRGIESLDRVVRTFGRENLSVRALVRSRDEVGRLGASFNAMAETIQGYSAQLERLLGAYGRFVPHQFLRLLAKDSVVDVKLGDNVEREMTVLFSDIRSFTSLSESMSPLQNFRFLNSYLERIGPVIRDAGGFIDKYIGDAVMALFPGGADDGLAAAVAMQRAVEVYNGHRRSSGYPPITIGIGVHSGTLMLGTIGEKERMDGSVIADAVNVCSRLEGLTRVYGAAILTTSRTLKRQARPGRFAVRFADRIQVKGRSETVLLFEVLDGDPADVRALKLSYRNEFARALRLYYGRSFGEAHRILTELRAANPRDEILRIFKNRCELYASLGVPEGWRGVEHIEIK